MVRDKEMEQFVNNHIISNFTIEIHELVIEAEVALQGTRGPLVAHWANAQCADFDAQFVGPFQDAAFELFLVMPAVHVRPWLSFAVW